MTVATGTKVIPLISSGSAGPLGAVHVPRLWLKLLLAAHGALPEDYDECGSGFDQMTIDNLGLNKEELIQFTRTKKPTYAEFEAFIQQHGKTDPDTIKKHNQSIFGYNHPGDKAEKMRHTYGIKDATINDAVTLNSMDDLYEVHRLVTV